MPAIEYVRPYLYPKQADAIFTNKRWALCEASTKSGKTVASIARFLEWGFAGEPGQNFWWVAPVSDQARIAFARVKQNLTPGTFTSKESPTPHILLINGPILWFKSADNPDSLYGEDVFGAVIDEASRARPDAWYAIRSTLTATRGPCVIIGNVKGRKNWFYEFCRRVEAGQEPNGQFRRITWHDAVEAGVLDLEEIEDARRNLPERVFNELYEAQASDDGGNPFGLDHIAKCTVSGLADGPPVAFGIDLAKKQDYFVVIGLNAQGQVCIFERWTKVPWRESIKRVHATVGEDIPALVDSTGVGDPVLEELQYEHGNFSGYMFTPASKQRIMEGLAVSIQGSEIEFPLGPISNELELFEYVYTNTGVRYSAPAGFNDDCVCALALARNHWTETQPGRNLTEYWTDTHRTWRNLNDQVEDRPLGRPKSAQTIGEEFAGQLENELTELYTQTINEYGQKALTCARCGLPTGATRVSDGAQVWHPECSS